MVRVACLLAVVLCGTLTAVADIPPPPPEKGFKRVPLEHVLKLEKEIPGYKFYTYSGSPGGGDTLGDELKLGTEKGVVVPGSSSASFWTGVVAIPESVLEKNKSKKKKAALLSRENRNKLPAGIVFYTTSGTNQDLKKNDPRDKVENVITISADEKAGVKFTASGMPDLPASAAPSESSVQPPSGTMFAGMAMSLAFVTSGLWWFRRKNEG